MLIGEAVIVIMQVLLLFTIIMFAAIPMGISWIYVVGALTIVSIGGLGLWLSKDAMHRRSAILQQQSLALKDRKHVAKVSALLLVSLLVQPLRYFICLKALGAHATITDALAIYVFTTMLAALPIGESAAGIAAAATVLGGAGGAAMAASIGLVLAGTSLLAACLYSSCTVYTLLPEAFRKNTRYIARTPHRCYQAITR